MTDGTLRVAFQGELGAFSEEAIQQLWLGQAEPMPHRDFSDVIAAVQSGAADRGVIPIENTIVGGIAAAHDAIIAAPDVHVTAETVVNVHHCLLGPPGATFDSVKMVLSHPVALAQCGAFFARFPRLEVHAVYDTGGAALDVSNVGDPEIAAVASRNAAQRYKLQVLMPDIEDRPDNQTRFLVVARAPEPHPEGTPVRTAVIITHEDRPGSLLRVLEPLARHGMDIRRLESRPTGDPWSYLFFLEFDHSLGEPIVQRVLSEMTAAARKLRVLGTFPRWNPGRRGSIGWRVGSPTPTH
ncbi:MAG: prephenate dehydratase domain-containing protein [Gemmatimonadota bacterium]|nr:prephenate dehydratase domain-containing protein [Gemmatimonadota bacterium]